MITPTTCSAQETGGPQESIRNCLNQLYTNTKKYLSEKHLATESGKFELFSPIILPVQIINFCTLQFGFCILAHIDIVDRKHKV